MQRPQPKGPAPLIKVGLPLFALTVGGWLLLSTVIQDRIDVAVSVSGAAVPKGTCGCERCLQHIIPR
jgi:hypothetical protein